MDSQLVAFPFRRVLITGGSGFLGRFVSARLAAFPEVELLAPRSSEYDLVSNSDVKRLLEETRPEIVIHLAASVGGIGYNEKNPATLFYDNLMMGAQLMEASRKQGVKKFVAVGTVCAYPKFTPVPFREDDLWNGYPEETNAPYGLAKKMMLVQAQAYRKQYGFNAIFLLPANLYGPGDNFDLDSSHVIPALIRKCVEARNHNDPFMQAWGTGRVSREFLYVDDCAEGILRAAALYNEAEPVNLGNGREVVIKDLVEMIASLSGYTGSITWQSDKPDGQPRRRLDVARAREKFGFEARTPFETGLRKTIDWYEQLAAQTTVPTQASSADPAS